MKRYKYHSMQRKSGSSDGELIESLIKEGKIVPSRITVSLLHNAMKKLGMEVFSVKTISEWQVPH